MTERMLYRRFYEVLEYAACKHEGQVRKGSGIPYIVHPVAVAETLASYSLPEDVVYAGLLHDVLEDADVTRKELAERFGEGVARLVAAVSETKKDGDGTDRPWEIRKAEQLAHLRTANADVVQLKAADVLHNITSICRDLRRGEVELWSRFKAGKELQLSNYYNIVAAISEALNDHPLVRELQAALRDLLAACA